MKTLLLSDNTRLQHEIEVALSSLDEFAEVWRTPVLADAAWLLVRDADVELVFIDLSWCGHHKLPVVIDAIHPWLEHAKVVLMLDRLEDFSQQNLRRVRADLCVPRSTPRHTFQSLVADAVWGTAQQRLAA